MQDKLEGLLALVKLSISGLSNVHMVAETHHLPSHVAHYEEQTNIDTTTQDKWPIIDIG